MASLSKKAQRTISRHLAGLFGKKAYVVPRSIDDFKVSNPLAREVRLPSGGEVLLTDAGLSAFRGVVSLLHDGGEFAQIADYSDLHSACRTVYAKLLSQSLAPDDAAEFVEMVRREIAERVSTFSFIVPVFGVQLSDVDDVQLGAFRLVHPSKTVIDAAGVTYDADQLTHVLDQMRSPAWLTGSATGTQGVALETFSTGAQITTGMLAVYAATLYEGGAMGFRIGTILSAEDAVGRGVGLMWNARDRSLVTQMRFARGQPFEIDRDRLDEIQNSSDLQRGFSLALQGKRSALEDAIARAIFWFSDAQRDQQFVMRLVKFWSCVECFFSANRTKITQDISVGLASVLVFGGYQFVPIADYAGLKHRITKMYDLRSQAVHSASHDHVTAKDVAVISQWAAWLIVNMLALIARGYESPDQVLATARMLDLAQDPPTSAG